MAPVPRVPLPEVGAAAELEVTIMDGTVVFAAAPVAILVANVVGMGAVGAGPTSVALAEGTGAPDGIPDGTLGGEPASPRTHCE